MYDIKGLMSTFLEYKLQFTNRLGNVTTHSLARHVAWNVTHIVLWGGNVLDFLA